MINAAVIFLLFFALGYGYGEEELYGALTSVLGATAALVIVVGAFPWLQIRLAGGQKLVGGLYFVSNRNAATAVIVGGLAGGWRQGWAYGLLAGGVAFAVTRIVTERGSKQSSTSQAGGAAVRRSVDELGVHSSISSQETGMLIGSEGTASAASEGVVPVRASDRFIARCFDIWVCSYAGMFLLGFAFPGAMESMLGSAGEGAEANPTLIAAISILVGMAIETLGYSFAGFTPGKSFFGISVLDKNGMNLTASAYASRQLLVWLQGMALGLGVLFTIAALVQFRDVRSSGETSYDRNRFEVRQRADVEGRRRAGRLIFAAAMFGWAYSIVSQM